MTWNDFKEYIYGSMGIIDPAKKAMISTTLDIVLRDIGSEMQWEFRRSTTPKEVVISVNTSSKEIADISEIRNITRVYLSTGTLYYIRPDAFRDRFQGQTILGTPTYYTVRNNILYVDATVSEDTTVYLDYFETTGLDFNLMADLYPHVFIAGVDYYLNLDKDSNGAKIIRYREAKKQMKKNQPLVQDKTEDSVHYDSRIKAANSYLEEIG